MSSASSFGCPNASDDGWAGRPRWRLDRRLLCLRDSCRTASVRPYGSSATSTTGAADRAAVCGRPPGMMNAAAAVPRAMIDPMAIARP